MSIPTPKSAATTASAPLQLLATPQLGLQRNRPQRKSRCCSRRHAPVSAPTCPPAERHTRRRTLRHTQCPMGRHPQRSHPPRVRGTPHRAPHRAPHRTPHCTPHRTPQLAPGEVLAALGHRQRAGQDRTARLWQYTQHTLAQGGRRRDRHLGGYWVLCHSSPTLLSLTLLSPSLLSTSLLSASLLTPLYLTPLTAGAPCASCSRRKARSVSGTDDLSGWSSLASARKLDFTSLVELLSASSSTA